MAPDVINPLPDVLPSSLITDATSDYVDDPQKNSPATSVLAPPHPRFYPIFDPPEIKSKRLAKEKAAALAQYDDELRNVIFDNDDDLPPSANIQASAARFASLCDDELFPIISQIPAPSATVTQNDDPPIYISPTGLNPVMAPLSTSDQPSTNTPTIPTSIGVGQGTTMSPYQYIINLHTAQSENTPVLDARESTAHHDHPSPSVIDSDSDSLTDDTSTTTMPSLDTE